MPRIRLSAEAVRASHATGPFAHQRLMEMELVSETIWCQVALGKERISPGAKVAT